MKRFLTLMIIPHSDEHVREFNLAAPVLWVGAGLAVLFLMIAAYFAYGYYARQGAEIAYTDLTQENAELESHVQTLRTRMSDLSTRVTELGQADTRMRAFARMTGPAAVAALDDEPAERTSFEASTGYATVGQLTHEAKRLADGYNEILAALSEAVEHRRHIPSIYPVRGEGWYSSNFGYRTDPITGLPSFNSGVDIAGRKGTPIVATADGKIDVARQHNRLGFTISIDHGNGFRTVYAHLEGLDLIRRGQDVSRGDVIGKMGRSGRTTAVHLHYAVMLNNKAQNPLDYIIEDRPRRSLF